MGKQSNASIKRKITMHLLSRITMKIGMNIQNHQRITLPDFGDSQTFPLSPPIRLNVPLISVSNKQTDMKFAEHIHVEP